VKLDGGYNVKGKVEDVNTLYGTKYKQVVHELIEKKFKMTNKWNLLKYFSDLLKDTTELGP
jgi:hypothetical protein